MQGAGRAVCLNDGCGVLVKVFGARLPELSVFLPGSGHSDGIVVRLVRFSSSLDHTSNIRGIGGRKRQGSLEMAI